MADKSKQLNSTDEVAGMLGLNPEYVDHSKDLPAATAVHDHAVAGKYDAGASKHEERGFSQIVGNLYMKKPAAHDDRDKELDPAHALHNATGDAHGLEVAAKPALGVRILRTIAPYLIIFTLGVFLYFFFFTSVDFSSLFRTRARVQSVQETALQQLAKQNQQAYYAWIRQFYYDVSDQTVLDPEADNSGNGLTNFQKYLLNLNPKTYDTLGLGMADSEALAKSINPLTGNALTDAQKQILGQYFDMEVIMNRLTMAHLQKQGNVAGSSITNNNSTGGYRGFDAPQTNAPATTQQNPPASTVLYNNLDINTKVPGRLEIPDMKISVPVIWTADVKNFDRDLQNGVVHYPGTAMPGQVGTAYISGHSSNYVWAKGSYNNVFTHLDDLTKNMSFKITVTLNNGKQATLYYVVSGSQQYNPKDQAQFINAGKSVVALSTCWPVGSTAKRLVVFGDLTQVQEPQTVR